MEQPIIILVANKATSLVKGVPLVLDGGITLKPIPNEHIGLLLGYRNTLSSVIFPKRKCFLIPHNHKIVSDNTIDDIHIALSFALTFFAKEGVLTCDRVFRTIKKRKLKISEEVNISNRIAASLSNDTSFKLDDGATPKDIDLVLFSTLESLRKDKSIRVTVERYISARTGADLFNKIIDMAISLESLFSGNQEISFRFSLFNSITSTKDANKRKEVYDLLRLLYSARSSIVHGSDIKKKQELEDNWAKIVDLARLAIIYKMNFLEKRNSVDWQRHLELLALGAEARIE